MDFQWKFRHRELSSGGLGHAALDRVTVGDPDPTAHPRMATGYRKCRFEWADKTSHILTLSWSCTRELGHQGQHLAGTGEEVAAVRPPLLSTATSVSV